MTLIFTGHNFKYEAEAVMKLFIPAESFNFLADCPPPPEGDYCLLNREISGGEAILTAQCRVNGRTLTSAGERVPLASDGYEHACELALCREMFRLMTRLTGITPKWGILTGVRPVKLVSRLAARLGEENLAEYMRRELFVDPEKTALSLRVAKNQRQILENTPKNSISLYVSIPFCPSRCAYCSFVSSSVEAAKRLIPAYVERLCDEISISAEAIGRLGLTLDSVYFGGGTPTSLCASDLEKIMSAIKVGFNLSSLREYTVEAGRPDTITEEKLNVIKSLGADRISVNPQTLRPEVLEAIGRRHTVEQFFEAYDLAKKVGFKAINVDLIAGLPKDTFDGSCETINKIIELAPENITLHTLSIKRAADYGHAAIAGSDCAEECVEYGSRRLTEAGYRPYYLYRQKNQLKNLENVGWERDGTAGVYNIAMMEETQSVWAVGAGGATKILRREGRIERFYNPKYPLEYLNKFNETVINRKHAAEKLLMEEIS